MPELNPLWPPAVWSGIRDLRYRMIVGAPH
jgi:hypothetical protein